MSCIAVSVSSRSASGVTSRNDRPSGPSTVRTPSLVNSRYAVLSAPSGSRSSYSNSGTLAPLNTTISNNAMSNAATCSRIGPRYGRRSQRRTWLEVACVTFLELGLPRWVGAGAGHRDRGAGQRTLNSRQHVGQRGGPQALTSLDATQKLGIQEPGEQACHEGVSCTDGVDDLNRWGVNAGQLAGNAERDQGAGETAGYHRQRGTQLTPQPQHVRDRRPLVQPGDVLVARLDHVAETDDIIGLSDVVKASDEDIAWLYEGAPISDVLRLWGQLGPALTVVTRGLAGALVALSVTGELTSVDAPTVEVVDTVGAGDSFMAGLLSGLLDAELLGGVEARERLRSASLADVLPAVERALACAAITVSRAGANPPRQAELQERDAGHL